jgi:hypothetical protein
MRLRLLLTGFALACVVLVVSPAFGQEGIGEKKQVIDARIDVLAKKIEVARAREGVLTSGSSRTTSTARPRGSTSSKRCSRSTRASSTG